MCFYIGDTFPCVPCSSAPQASGETPWLRTAVSLHLSSVWARVLGGKTPSHGNSCWGPHHPHPSNRRGLSSTHHPYSAGQSPGNCGGQKGQPSFLWACLCVCVCFKYIMGLLFSEWAVKKNQQMFIAWPRWWNTINTASFWTLTGIFDSVSFSSGVSVHCQSGVSVLRRSCIAPWGGPRHVTLQAFQRGTDPEYGPRGPGDC